MKITEIQPDSLGEELGLKIGDDLVRINGEPVRDGIDYRYLIAEEDLEMEVLKDGQTVIYEIEKDFDEHLGLEFEEIKIRYCGNDCPFCFVDQNPEGMRSALYFRDEDFRLSFLSGHYVTLTNLSKRDMDRIVRQRLSPLFVSVHATDPQVRKFMFGIKHDDRLFHKLDFLTKHGIEIHTQIVLCPEVNDGPVLKKTIWDLANYQPNLKSVSIVPVGLTKHRQGLKKLKPVTGDYAARLLEIADSYASEFRSKTGEYFVYSADEFYIMAGEPIPQAERYDGFYQKENGVGMVRYLLDDFEKQTKRFPKKLNQRFKVTLVTATLASGFMDATIVPALNGVQNLEARLEVVGNDFYGSSIRITGLLTGQDIYRHLKDVDLGDKVYLPANCLKDGALFLDDWTVDQLSSGLGCPIESLDDDFSAIFDNVV
ncbi:DUF512 domain-containing protein [candidate division KSB1 bacterium]|nr:DUF512 domain-containing protein [candidate division KSB1 bacterium]NIR72285.1 DUF512 domain-containing protein [candidate division KSB1 bacterium]NIS24256.1 DUF512 domain-containing protein [candidate division KSB1 bacterium]NIT71171.1 DUF512 domain-containing protein [candidate division KSB1 bacterium]NIU24875.1 DUF512 domain-containing protein [candidate division KSB1 bacterium]